MGGLLFDLVFLWGEKYRFKGNPLSTHPIGLPVERAPSPTGDSTLIVGVNGNYKEVCAFQNDDLFLIKIEKMNVGYLLFLRKKPEWAT